MLFILLLFFVAVISSKVCVKTFEEGPVFYKPSSVTSIEMKMNAWLNLYPNIDVINVGVYRSDDRYDSYHGGYVSYRCESIQN